LVSRINKKILIIMKYIKDIDLVNESLGESSDLVGRFFVRLLGARAQSHMFHWQTKSYARHMAFGDFYDEWLVIVDEIAEAVMGVRSQRHVIGDAMIPLVDYSDENIRMFIQEGKELLTTELTEVIGDEREEIHDLARTGIALLDKLEYLLTLD